MKLAVSIRLDRTRLRSALLRTIAAAGARLVLGRRDPGHPLLMPDLPKTSGVHRALAADSRNEFAVGRQEVGNTND